MTVNARAEEDPGQSYVAALVVVPEGILLVRHARRKHFDLPGGLIEPSEAPRRGLLRIVAEQVPGVERISTEMLPGSGALDAYAPANATPFLYAIRAERDPMSRGRGPLDISIYPRSEPRLTQALTRLLREYVNHQA